METSKLVTEALNAIKKFLQECITSTNERRKKTANLLSYWIKDYIRMLRREDHSTSFHRYKRGDVLKVHLGYRIGSEEGGLHYVIVITANDSPNSPVLTVVPLTSLKSADQVNHLHFSELFIGAELLQKLHEKINNEASPSIAREIFRMKWGSIVLLNQMVTISKLRIYDPVRSDSPLRGIRLSSETMNRIDEKLKQILFLKK